MNAAEGQGSSQLPDQVEQAFQIAEPPQDWKERAEEAEAYLGRILRAVRIDKVAREIEFARTRYGTSLNFGARSRTG